MTYSWDWGVFWRSTVFGDGIYLEWILRGAGWTIATSLAAWVVALVLGTALGIALTWPARPIRVLGRIYVEVFRNIPLIVQMFLWYFVFPELLPDSAGDWVKREMPLPTFTTAVVALGFFTAARVAVQVAAGIAAQGRGQAMAARALGMTDGQAYRKVLVPNALRIVAPTLATEFMSIVKNSAVALTIGLVELTAAARAIGEYTFQAFEAFTAATILYIVFAYAANRVAFAIERRTAVPGLAGTDRTIDANPVAAAR